MLAERRRARKLSLRRPLDESPLNAAQAACLRVNEVGSESRFKMWLSNVVERFGLTRADSTIPDSSGPGWLAQSSSYEYEDTLMKLSSILRAVGSEPEICS
mmetsp:Transcript_17559/g.44105  ORF Transcript_17559/g.44105 Transcript_17559/m.44105 type:complete len:101 (-) Transcript_17559:986-1288(-)